MNRETGLFMRHVMEHVGTLPILATYFHGHVTEPVNLGRVLELLAVHDIGEIVVGDESTFTKKEDRRRY